MLAEAPSEVSEEDAVEAWASSEVVVQGARPSEVCLGDFLVAARSGASSRAVRRCSALTGSPTRGSRSSMLPVAAPDLGVLEFPPLFGGGSDGPELGTTGAPLGFWVGALEVPISPAAGPLALRRRLGAGLGFPLASASGDAVMEVGGPPWAGPASGVEAGEGGEVDGEASGPPWAGRHFGDEADPRGAAMRDKGRVGPCSSVARDDLADPRAQEAFPLLKWLWVPAGTLDASLGFPAPLRDVRHH